MSDLMSESSEAPLSSLLLHLAPVLQLVVAWEGQVGAWIDRTVGINTVTALMPYLPCEQQAKECAAMAASGTGFYTLGQILPRCISYCLLLSVLRWALTLVAFRPLAIRCLRLRFPQYRRIAAIDNTPALCKDKPSPEAIRTFCKTHWKDNGNDSGTDGEAPMLYSEEEVRQYLRVHGTCMSNERRIVKFIEALWRFLFYSAFVALGVYVLLYPGAGASSSSNSSSSSGSAGPVVWVEDPINFWVGWPLQHVPNAVMLLYYEVEVGAYLHQLLWTEVSRSDAFEMILHHFVTLALLLGSYMTNFTRIGSYILLLHDAADIFLELGKVLNYTARAWRNKPLGTVCDGFFAVFAVTFFGTRLVLYPKAVLYQLFVHCIAILGPFSGLPFFKVFLSTLQCLHVFWFYLIARMVVIMFATGKVDDIREEEDEDEEPEQVEGEGSSSGRSGKPPAAPTPAGSATKKTNNKKNK